MRLILSLLLLPLALFISVTSCFSQSRLVINEIMYSPVKPEPQWVEIYNVDSVDIDLSGWTIGNLSTRGSLPHMILARLGFLVLTKDTASLRQSRPGNYAVMQCTMHALKKSGDYLILRDSSGVVRDSVHFLASWGGTGGKSLERKRPADSSNMQVSWGTSLNPNGATPGTINSYLTTAIIPSGAVVINEIMFAPTKPEPEWIELLNTSRDTLDIGGWSLKVSHYSPAQIPNIHSLIPPDSFLVVTSNDTLLASIRKLNPLRILRISLHSLSNTGSDIVLQDQTGATIDSASYQGSWVKQGGHSLERIDYRQSGSLGSNWSETNDSTGSTALRANSVRRRDHDLSLLHVYDSRGKLKALIGNPGRDTARSVTLHVNCNPLLDITSTVSELILPADSLWVTLPDPLHYYGQFAGEANLADSFDERHSNDSLTFTLSKNLPRDSILINEILFAPKVGSCEWIELYNRSEAIVSLGSCGLSIQHYSGNSKHVIPGLIIPSAAYGIIAANSEFLTSHPDLSGRSEISILGRTSLDLPKDSGSVSILNPDSTVVDSIKYNAAWQSNIFATTLGVSLERKTWERRAVDSTNWMSSTDSTGSTPLAKNSTSRAPKGGDAGIDLITISPNPFSPDGDGFEDEALVQVRTATDQTYALRIRVFDMNGRLRRTVADNTPYSQSISLAFDGKDDAGRTLPLGLYTVFIELNSPSGSIQKKIGLAVAGGRR